MTSETTTWFIRKAPVFAQLQPDEKNGIYDFSLLWSLFEGSQLNCNCNFKKIKQFVSQLEQRGKLSGINLDVYVSYLRNRYYDNGSPTPRYKYLYVERSGKAGEVEVLKMLRNEGCSTEVQLIGCLVVVFRLRNNLFHGEKWQYQLQGQHDNFQHANEFLRYLMDVIYQ